MPIAAPQTQRFLTARLALACDVGDTPSEAEGLTDDIRWHPRCSAARIRVVDHPLVIVVCGASGVGKSSVAVPLAHQTCVPLAEADDLVTALKALTTATTHPALHYWDTHPEAASWTAQQIVEHTLTVAAELAAGLRAVIADHIAFAAPVVIEGDCLTPDLIDGFGTAARAVVISEPDEDQIIANFWPANPRR